MSTRRSFNKACVPCRARKVKCDAAVTGVPCSSCTIRQCAEHCHLPSRKARARKAISSLPTPSQASDTTNLVHSLQSHASPQGLPSVESQSPRPEPDLLYLNILNDAVKETAESHGISHSRQKFRTTEIDAIDHEYLTKKGVFDLPSRDGLDSLVKTYFDHVYPFSPVINRMDFIRNYRSGNNSVFLLYAMLATACLHASEDVLSAHGFESRAAAEESFFTKAKLTLDFDIEKDTLTMLQGSIILNLVMLDHPSNKDYDYWFHNAVRLATKLDLRNICERESKPRKVLKLYRRIWWTLYSLDIFHVFVNTKRSRLIPETCIKPRTEDDWEEEDILSSGILSAISASQKALPIVSCEVCRISSRCLSIVKEQPRQDPRQILAPIDEWRKSLATRMHVGEHTGTNIYYLNVLAMSYRFECIISRLIRRQSRNQEWTEWASQRLRSAILELNTIAMRVLANGNLHAFPIPFITTMTALLALHIESALNPSETDLVHSMARISISQTMLVLNQGKDIPALKRALPIFEDILAKKNLSVAGQHAAVRSIESKSLEPPSTPNGAVQEWYEDNPSFDVDLIGFDFLDEWQMGQMDFDGQY